MTLAEHKAKTLVKQAEQGYRPATKEEVAAWVLGGAPKGVTYRLVAGVGLLVPVEE